MKWRRQTSPLQFSTSISCHLIFHECDIISVYNPQKNVENACALNLFRLESKWIPVDSFHIGISLCKTIIFFGLDHQFEQYLKMYSHQVQIR